MKARRRHLLQGFVILATLGLTAAAAYWLIASAPTTAPEDKKAAAKIVRVMDLTPTNLTVAITAYGTVIPAREVRIQPQVSGQVVEQHPQLVPGGRLTKGDTIVRIDPRDYEMALTEREAELEEARFEFDVEAGRQLIAKREFDQLRKDLPDSDLNPALALREPQLRLTQAKIAKAENAIERAELDVSRATIEAPFNSLVASESVELGQLVEAGNDICRLVGTDAYWIQTTLPIADLDRIRLPAAGEDGAKAQVFLDTGRGEERWVGQVVKLLPDLESEGRMARLLIEVLDPLDQGAEKAHRVPLLLGSYVKVEIEAGRLTDVLEIPRVALREGDRLWLVGTENRIRIVHPEILWTRQETVLVPLVHESGERLVISELKAALPGMVVNPQPLEDEEAPEEEDPTSEDSKDDE